MWPSGYSKDRFLETLVSKSLSFADRVFSGRFSAPVKLQPQVEFQIQISRGLSDIRKVLPLSGLARPRFEACQEASRESASGSSGRHRPSLSARQESSDGNSDALVAHRGERP